MVVYYAHTVERLEPGELLALFCDSDWKKKSSLALTRMSEEPICHVDL